MTHPAEATRALEVCEVLLATPSRERQGRLAELVAGDERLRSEVEALLDYEQAAENVIASLGRLNLPRDEEPDPFPESIDAFRVVRRLGRGGMGTVWLVEQEEPLHRLVALKVLSTGTETRETLERFRGEHRALARMNHDGIARIFEAGVTDSGKPFFTMEYVDGLPLLEYATEHRLDLPAKLRLFLGVCRTVEYVHRQGVLHRDIKPSNILVADAGGVPRPKLIDFGIAKSLDRPLHDATGTRLDGINPGTPAYMSPEQLSGGHRVDPRTDVWALGVTLYELVTSSPAFAATSAGELVRRVLEDDPALARTLVPDLPRELDDILVKATAKQPACRYASPGALAADLEHLLEGETVLAAAPARRAGRWLRRRRKWVAGTAVAFGVLAAATAAVMQRSSVAAHQRRLEREARELEQARYGVEVDEARKALAAGDVDRARALLGPWTRRAPGEETAGIEVRLLWRRLGPPSVSLESPGPPIAGIVFLPDARTIAGYAHVKGSQETVLAFWSLQDGRLLQERPPIALKFEACDLEISPEGSFLGLASHWARECALVEVAFSTVRRFTVCDSASPTVAVAPGGNAIAVSTSTITVCDTVAGGSRFAFRADENGASRLFFSADGSRILGASSRSLRAWDRRAARIAGASRPACRPSGLAAVSKVDLASRIVDVAVSRGTDEVLALEQNGEIVVLDGTTLEVRGRYPIDQGDAVRLSVSADGTRIATASAGGRVVVASGRPPLEEHTFRASSEQLADLELSPDGALLATVDAKGVARLWPLGIERPAEAIGRTATLLWGAVFLPGGGLLAEGDGLHFTRFALDPQRGRLEATGSFPLEAWSAGGIDHDICHLDPTGEANAVSTRARTVRLFAVPPERSSHAIPVRFDLAPAFEAPLYALGFSRDGSVLAAASLTCRYPECESHVRIWRRAGREQGGAAWKLSLEFTSNVAGRTFAVLPRSGLLVYGGRQETPIEVRDLDRGDRIGSFRAQPFVSCLAASPDERHLVTAGENGTLELWTLPRRSGPGGRSPPPRRVLSAVCHRGRINCLAFFPDGRRLATGPENGPVRLWRLVAAEKGQGLQLHESLALEHPGGRVKGLAVSPNGRTLAAAGGPPKGEAKAQRGWLQLWYGAGDDELAAAAVRPRR